jgi:hypothetical protein
MSVQVCAPACICTPSLIRNCTDDASNCTHLAQLSSALEAVFFSLSSYESGALSYTLEEKSLGDGLRPKSQTTTITAPTLFWLCLPLQLLRG